MFARSSDGTRPDGQAKLTQARDLLRKLDKAGHVKGLQRVGLKQGNRGG